MMLIQVRFVCTDVFGPLKSGEYELAEGGTVADLMEQIRLSLDGAAREDMMQHIIFLRNGSSAQGSTPLTDGDSLIVMRRRAGG
jgi:sulfur carrier protein ThiS